MSTLTSVDVLLDDMLVADQLRQHVDGPTHRAGNLLDVLLTHENSRLVVNCTRCDPGLSDHSMVLADLDARRPPPLIRRIRYRSIKRVDPDAFCTMMCDTDVIVRPADDVDAFALQLDAAITGVLDCLAPLRTSTRRGARRPKYWLSDEAHCQAEASTS